MTTLYDDDALDLLQLAFTPGLGPIRIARCIEHFGSPAKVLRASPKAFESVPGIGPKLASQISSHVRTARQLALEQLDAAASIGATILLKGFPGYPALLAELDDAPVMLMVKGRIDHDDLDRYPVGIVGSRNCTLYGTEQAERFSAALARAGLTVVSGGARGIDTAAHSAAIKSGGRTIVVLGCGLGHIYPDTNAALFDRIVAEDRGAIVSELPIDTAPNANNFPSRNRIISGLSLGVLVIEAGARSGALITARVAAEEHGREVMALPGRVDSVASRGTLELIRDAAAAAVIEPADVIATLENAARHHFSGTHEARFVDPVRSETSLGSDNEILGAANPLQSRILAALDSPRTADQLAQALEIESSTLRSELTMLELARRIQRTGSTFVRVTTAR
ncbi:MAG: DNA-processing protein DprA [Phycisphaeraceae bacterium]|nr:DNA-processing protein DprA [Phycisphaeraceae bacterium]MCW5761680.1 DNA-processing protein DprA [Phycisphaeraceae bacterium]